MTVESESTETRAGDFIPSPLARRANHFGRKPHTLGTHRAAPLEATRRKIESFLEPMGITRVAHITGLDCIGIPVVLVCRPNSRSLAVAQGKGHSKLAAEVSGLMESIEFYHAETISSPLVFGSYNQLRGTHRLFNPHLLPTSGLSRYHDELKIHFIEAMDLIQQKACWVPFELVHTDFTHPLPSDSGCFPMTSNGLASGNEVGEAVVHAACEVIERDAEALFLLLPPEAQDELRVRLETIDDPLCLWYLEKFEKAAVDVAVWDMTTDLGLPCFRAAIVDREFNPNRPLRPNIGSGCHLSREVALSRALTEAAQSRLTVISSSRDDLRHARFEEALDLQRLKALRADALRGTPTRSFVSAPSYEHETFEEDLLCVRARLEASGIEHLLVVNLTKPEFQIPVVRVIIPELESMVEAPGWRPGRRAQKQAGF
jgi:YcaO-like protein with predicted kinase domain